MQEKLKEQVSISRGFLWLLGAISPITLLGGIFYLGVLKSDIESRLFDSQRQKQEVIRRAESNSEHYNYKQLSNEFVPRYEITEKLEDMSAKLDKISDKLNVN